MSRKVRPRPMNESAVAALARGAADEQHDAIREHVLPSAVEMMSDPQFLAAYQWARSSYADERVAKADRVRPGVAMALIDADGVDAGLKLARPVGIDWQEIRDIARRFIFLQMIAQTRIRQVQRFLVRPKKRHQPGFNLVFKEEGREVRDEDKKRFTWLRSFLMSGGAEFDPRVMRALQRDHLHDFTAKHLRDSLHLDHAPVELMPAASGRVHGFAAADAAMIYRTDPTWGMREDYSGPATLNRLMGRTKFGDPTNIVAVRVQDGEVVAQYTHMDLLLPVRNPTTDGRYYDYGIAEPEELMGVAGAWLDAFTLNRRSINDNSIPRGVWSVVGEYGDHELARLKTMFDAQLRGANNRFRAPVFVNPNPVAGAGITFVPTGTQPEEQMYARWITLLVAIACALYSIDPAEISFESYSAQSSSLSGGDTEAKLTSGADKGLHTLLARYARTLNEILYTVDDEVELEWSGLDDSKEDAAEQDGINLSLRESRARAGESNDGWDDDLLDAPINPVLMPIYQAKLQQKMAPQGAQIGPDGKPLPPGAPGAPQPGASGPPQQDDPLNEEGPNGERRMQDHEGALWQVNHGQPQPTAPKAPPAEARLAKAHQPTLFEVWPGNADG